MATEYLSPYSDGQHSGDGLRNLDDSAKPVGGVVFEPKSLGEFSINTDRIFTPTPESIEDARNQLIALFDIARPPAPFPRKFIEAIARSDQLMITSNEAYGSQGKDPNFRPDRTAFNVMIRGVRALLERHTGITLLTVAGSERLPSEGDGYERALKNPLDTVLSPQQQDKLLNTYYVVVPTLQAHKAILTPGIVASGTFKGRNLFQHVEIERALSAILPVESQGDTIKAKPFIGGKDTRALLIILAAANQGMLYKPSPSAYYTNHAAGETINYTPSVVNTFAAFKDTAVSLHLKNSLEQTISNLREGLVKLAEYGICNIELPASLRRQRLLNLQFSDLLTG